MYFFKEMVIGKWTCYYIQIFCYIVAFRVLYTTYLIHKNISIVELVIRNWAEGKKYF